MTGWYRFRADPSLIIQGSGQQYKGRPACHLPWILCLPTSDPVTHCEGALNMWMWTLQPAHLSFVPGPTNNHSLDLGMCKLVMCYNFKMMYTGKWSKQTSRAGSGIPEFQDLEYLESFPEGRGQILGSHISLVLLCREGHGWGRAQRGYCQAQRPTQGPSCLGLQYPSFDIYKYIST